MKSKEETDKFIDDRFNFSLQYNWIDTVIVDDVKHFISQTRQADVESILSWVDNTILIPVNPSNDNDREWYRGLGKEIATREIRDKLIRYLNILKQNI